MPTTVVVCDDDPEILDLLSCVLTDMGIVVQTAPSGEHACARVREGGIDLLILDRKMPGMPGEEVLRELKGDAATRALPVVMLTSSDDMGTISHCLSLGAAEFVAKPVNLKLLCAVVNRVLGVRAPSTAPSRAGDAGLSAEVARMGHALTPILAELERRYAAAVAATPDVRPLREAGVRVSEMRALLEELLAIVEPTGES